MKGILENMTQRLNNEKQELYKKIEDDSKLENVMVSVGYIMALSDSIIFVLEQIIRTNK